MRHSRQPSSDVRARYERRVRTPQGAKRQGELRCCGVGRTGAVGGAVIGGILGHQVGGGRGNDIATVAGAVGGAVAGNEVEKHVNASKRYELTVLFDDGIRRVFNESNLPVWHVGDKVKIINGTINSGT